MEEQPIRNKGGRPRTTGGASGMMAYHKTSSRLMYHTYLEKSDNPVPLKVFLDIVHGFFKYIALQLLDGFQVQLPNQCGELTVVGNKIKPKIVDGKLITTNLAPDWATTFKVQKANPQAAEERRIIYHLNEHTNGVRYRVKWIKTILNNENKTFYSFQLAKPNKLALHKKIMAGKDYIGEN